MTQLSIERKGRITASQVHKLLNPKGFGVTGENYLWEVITELEGGELEPITSRATAFGIENEQWALEMFKEVTNYQPFSSKFYKKGDYLGASPDAEINHKFRGRSLIEVKSPYVLTNHVKNYKLLNTQEDLKKLHFDYYCQIQLQLYCSNLETAFFVSFCGLDAENELRFNKQPIKILEVKKDTEFQNFMFERLMKAIEFINKYVSKQTAYVSINK